MLSKLSVKKPYTVIVGIILVIVLGYISFQHMTTDLLPSMNLPYVVVYTPYPGATPEQVEDELTRPMEASFATLNDIKKVTSQSRDNVAVVIMQFNDGANMDTALIEISSRLDQLKGGWGDDVGAPVTLKLNPDMLPVAILSVSKDDMDVVELSDYVTDELVPAFEGLNGVASANASGVIEQEIDVTIEQSRIDVLNSAVLRDIDEELADVERQLDEGQAKISDGRRQLARAKGAAYSQIAQALDAIEKGEKQITPAIEQLTQQRDALKEQREQLAASVSAMEGLVNLTDDEKATVKRMLQQLAALKQRRQELEEQLATRPASEALADQRADAQAQRDQLAAERDAQQAYIDDLQLMDADALRGEIARLEGAVQSDEAALDSAKSELDDLQAKRPPLQAKVDDLTARLAAIGGDPTDAPEETDSPEASGDPTDAPTNAPTDAPTDDPTDAPTDAPSDAPTDDPTGAPAGEEASPAPEATEGAGEVTDAPANDTPANDPSSNGVNDTPANDTPANETSSSDASSGDTAEGDAPAEPGDLSALLKLNRALADEPDPAELRAQLDQAKDELAALDRDIEAKSSEVSRLEGQLDADQSDLSAKRRALETLEADGEDVEARKAEAQQQIAGLDARIAALDLEIAGIDQLLAQADQGADILSQQIAIMDQQMEAIESSPMVQAAGMLEDEEQLAAQYAQAQSGLAEMDAGIEKMDETIDKLSRGIIPGGYIEGIDQDTKLSDAKSQLEAAESMMGSAFAKAQSALDEADAELAKARKEFNEKRDEAYENAGLDGIITVQTVAGLLGAQNLSMPAGYVKDLEGDQVLVRVGDKFGSLDELKRMKLFQLGLDSVDEVRLLDVASVEMTDNRDDVFTKLDGQDGILLTLDKQSTFSTADVADTILEKARAMQEADPGLHIVDLMNQGEYIDLVVSSVLNNLITGGGLAILILLLFLLDWRPTLTVAFSIPISVVIAFVCMYFSGITLNVLSLSGLALGIGMLVDNSIVSIENIYRLHGEEGVPLLRACVEGVKSVSGALLSSTLTTICVFLPIVFVQGMARDLFADMGLTIAYSLLASLFVAMTVVPMMTSFLMRRSRPKPQRLFSRFQAGYTALLRGALRVKPLVLIAALGLLAFSAMQVSKMGISFMPEVNSRQMSASLTPDTEMSLKDQRAQAAAIMDEMLDIEGIQSIGLMDGSGSMLSAGGGYSYYIIVDEAAGRKNTDIAAEIEAVGQAHGADLSAQASTMDISMMTGSGISVEITGDDIETLQAIAMDVAQIARETEGIVDVNDGLEDAVPEVRIVVDKERAIEEGLTTGQVYQFIAQKLMGKVEVTKVTLDGKEMKVQLIEGRNQGLTPEDIQDLEIEVEKEDEDKMVRIGDISTVRDAQSLSTINRASQRRMVTVSFGIADGYSANLVSDAFEEKLKACDLPAGYSAELAGENETVMGIMDDLVWMIVVAVLLIFLIMVAQFQSFKSPIIVMFTIPLAFTGGLLALILTKMDLSIVAMLGFLVLSGVVVNNGIVFIDCVNQLRIGGMEKKDALVEAGRQRLRPILMTALTTILGMSTMALGHGTGAEMMQPMAVVSIGGLTYATLMTLFVVPVLYDLLNGRKMKAREIQMIREAAGMNGDEVLEDEPVDGPAPASEPAPEPVTEVKPESPDPVAEVKPEPPVAQSEPAPAAAPEPAPAEASPADVPPMPVFGKTGPGRPLRVRLSSGKKR